MIRPDVLRSARAELASSHPTAAWPLHWSCYQLSRAEQDRLLHEVKYHEKWPEIMKNERYAPPPKANAEQASSEATAAWKAAHLLPPGSQKVLDLSAGSGIDTWAFERSGCHVTCIEPDPYLVELLKYNGRDRGRHVIQGTAETFCGTPDQFDLVYVDPSRREDAGRRIDVADLGEPNPDAWLTRWLEWAPWVVLKLSPMLDRHAVLKRFPQADRVVYLSRRREVKELLVRIPREASGRVPLIWGVDVDVLGTEHYRIEAHDVTVPIQAEIQAFLHDPDPALIAAGADRAWADHAGYQSVHPGIQLYTSNNAQPTAGGRHFRVESVHPTLPTHLDAASVVTKGFPERADALRARLKLREDSERFLFAVQRGRRGAKTYVVAQRIR